MLLTQLVSQYNPLVEITRGAALPAESSEPRALGTAKPETSQDQRQSSCVTDPFVPLIDRELQN